MNYCNEVHGFINFATSIPRNFSGGGIRFPCRRCKNKKVSAFKYCNDASSTQMVHWDGELFVRNESMVEKIAESTSSASNVHKVVNDNTNSYKNMVMDAMRMNQCNVSQCPIVEEELNADAIIFFDLLKDSDEPLWNDSKNYSKLLVVAQVFTIKSDYGLSEADCDRIIK